MDKETTIKRVQLIGDHACLENFSKALANVGISSSNKNPQLILIAGGDGAYLHAMNSRDFPNIPCIGVNVGSLGYYQELTTDDFTKLAWALKNKNYHIESRMLIETVGSNHKEVHVAINDIVISRASSQAMQIELSVGLGRFPRFVGDGLIFSTPQGSTGYAVSAGGAVVAEAVETIQITPSNAHHSILYESLRAPLVVPAHIEIKLKVLEPHKRPVSVIVDGRDINYSASAALTIRKSAKVLSILHLYDYDYFKNLADKMVHRH